MAYDVRKRLREAQSCLTSQAKKVLGPMKYEPENSRLVSTKVPTVVLQYYGPGEYMGDYHGKPEYAASEGNVRVEGDTCRSVLLATNPPQGPNGHAQATPETPSTP